ncbi:MAG: hypothetical protein CM1200mP2_01380 [Planctomycetaceae bacterium]|nr:MAG: hypothetical protein CM1200mP2_01380 [Planctomycetaceae bacterium]
MIIVGPGLVAVLLYPELDQADHAFPQLVAGLLPAGLRGIFLAAFLAALMSSVDSYLNSASTLVAHDIYKGVRSSRGRCGGDAARRPRVTAILVIWSIACAMVMARLDEGIYTIFQTLMSFFQGPALAVCWPGHSGNGPPEPGPWSGFPGGLVTTVGQFLLNNDAVCSWLGLRPLFQIDEPFLYYSIWGFLVAGGLLVTVSLLTRREPDEKTSLTVLR